MEYEVVRSWKKKEMPAKEGQKAKQVIGMILKVGGEEKPAEWFTDFDTPLPEGKTPDGDLNLDPQWGLKFTKKRGGGGGRGGGRSEEDQRRIVRQHSQKCAVDLIKVAHELGLVKPKGAGETPLERVSELADMVKAIAHNLEADVYRKDSN